MIYTPLTKLAMRIAYRAHSGQLDRSGLPYIFHPLHVAEQMRDEITCTAALLHDVIEDTKWTLQELSDVGIPEPVCRALALLTHDPSVPYFDYVRALSANPVARAVKLEDLRHNSDLTRLDHVTEQDRQRLKKYQRAAAILEETPPDSGKTAQ